MTTPSPVPRRIRPPSWLDLRLVVGVLLVLGSVLLGAKVVSDAGHSYRMLSVARDLAAGTVLHEADVTTVQVRLPAASRGQYLAAGTDVAGRRLNRPMTRGELLPAAALASPAPMTTVTIPFADGTAPHLTSGQRIEVWLSTASCPSLVLLGDVTVQAVDDSNGAFGSGGGQDVVISLAPPLAQRVVGALALHAPVIRAGVLTGAARPGANDDLPDLAGCAGAPAS